VLAALGAAAISVFGVQDPSHADSPPGRIRASYSFSDYQEDKLAAHLLKSGSRQRFNVQSHQFTVGGSVTERIDLSTNIVYERMSGATPWWVEPEPDNELLQAMTGATISEERVDVNLNGSFYFDSGRAGGSFGVSTENDYLAIYGGVNGEHSLNDANTTLSGAFDFSVDRITPTGGGPLGRVVEADKYSLLVSGGLSQILARGTIFQSSLSYKYSDGFLSDPYKRSWIGDFTAGTVPDSRPDQRNQIAWLNQLRQHFEGINASVHLDYQFYWDDWDITSHSFDLRWYQNFFDGIVQIIPSFRYYSQSQPYFYAPVYFNGPRADGLASSDYRLSPFGAISFGARIQGIISDWPGELDWRLGFQYERYESDAGWALGKVNAANPGLVDFNVYYVTLEMKY